MNSRMRHLILTQNADAPTLQSVAVPEQSGAVTAEEVLKAAKGNLEMPKDKKPEKKEVKRKPAKKAAAKK